MLCVHNISTETIETDFPLLETTAHVSHSSEAEKLVGHPNRDTTPPASVRFVLPPYAVAT